MAFNEELAERIRLYTASQKGIEEKKMFGGIAFMLRGKMFCGIVKDELMVRLKQDRYEAALQQAHVREMDFTGRPMRGYVFVSPEGLRTERQLSGWVEFGIECVRSLPTGKKKK